MSQVTAPDRRDPLWRTLRERADDPRFRALLRREFPGVDPDRLEGVDRRRFLQLLGASMALATATGCRWEEERILSLNRRPEGLVPGATRSLSTAFRVDDEVYGIRVTTYDGRPIKVEGNPEHPLSLGATDARAQASILSLYDPDRRTGVMRPGTEGKAQASWRSFEQAFDQRLARNRVDGGRGLALLTEVSTSPTLARLERRFRAAFPAARWVAWSPTAGETAREGARLAFGRPVAARLDLTAARVVVALDGDLLHEGPEALRLARELTERRHPDGEMLRLYAVESRFTGTGMAADHRLPLRSRDVPAFLDLVERALDAREGRGGTHSERARRLATYRRAADVAEAIADDLLAARGAGVLTAGPTQPAAVHARLFALNARLGNLGRTVRLFEPVPTAGARGHDALAELAAAL
ncbi:MAG: TAT-variant-translocated molybdopterin oxidoreductase, partial [Planctomycetota bacterium]